MAAQYHKGATVRPVGPKGTLSVGSTTSSTIVFNTNAKAVTGAGTTGADSDRNPFGVLAGTSTNNANVVVVSVPDGANFLDLAVEYNGPAPTINAVVRCFGEVPEKPEGGTDGIHASWPVDFDASGFNNPGSGKSDTDWKPLADFANEAFAVTIGNASFANSQTNGTSNRTELATINLAGSKRVMVLISTACVTPTEAMVIGWFGN